MQARDVMSGPVITAAENATVGEAARLMLEKGVSCLPVVDEQDLRVGILTHTGFPSCAVPTW